MTAKTTRVKTSDLDEKFKIGKNTRVNRLAMLGFTPDRLVKEGRFYYLSPEQLEVFTDFDRYISQTGSPDGFPKLLANYSDRPVSSIKEPEIPARISNQDSPAGELITTPEGDELADLLGHPDILSSVTGEFTGMFDNSSPDLVENVLAQHLVIKAQRKATAMLLAENALADQYINNPHLLDPTLRAQLDSFQFTQTDPKGLAASLIAAAQRLPKAA
ncbi:hypothetical protein [Chamaesiphon minutus]|uniref:Uncharacterized protein n=1 Tax=Chamaesiphon minutus (strain ATCC 27169 / PCC 6605) TaxID=1173020 RepID=K9UE90_CHAP6|nr:hypothetical protein [Chamaesiphon minutus]AFY93145.1 hypothetical protein Cha6605_2049 [Chamaesiphon minutus PCC 6605]